MAIPSEKSGTMSNMLEILYGRTTHITNNTCITCGGMAKTFRDDLSRKEYTISGLCQKCQDKFFGIVNIK